MIHESQVANPSGLPFPSLEEIRNLLEKEMTGHHDADQPMLPLWDPPPLHLTQVPHHITTFSLYQTNQSLKTKPKAIELSKTQRARSADLRPTPPQGSAEASMSHPNAPPPLPPLYKQNSWAPDMYRDEAWLRRKGNHGRRKRRSKSVTDEDLDELKACIELGFGFDSPEMDKRLSDTLPALGLYYAVNKQYCDTVSKSSSLSSTASESDTSSPLGSPRNIFDPGDNPQNMKTRLKQWAQVVACSVRQSSC